MVASDHAPIRRTNRAHAARRDTVKISVKLEPRAPYVAMLEKRLGATAPAQVEVTGKGGQRLASERGLSAEVVKAVTEAIAGPPVT